jgi:FAD-dependent oxidoreductase domain-containing protein 1
VKSAWAGYYEYNTFDENGIIGPHPYYHNLYIATGFSGHGEEFYLKNYIKIIDDNFLLLGIQQAPAVGRAISELIIDGAFRSVDLTRLGFDRIIVDTPMREVNIV